MYVEYIIYHTCIVTRYTYIHTYIQIDTHTYTCIMTYTQVAYTMHVVCMLASRPYICGCMYNGVSRNNVLCVNDEINFHNNKKIISWERTKVDDLRSLFLSMADVRRLTV